VPCLHPGHRTNGIETELCELIERNIVDGSHTPAIQNAIAAWNEVGGTTAHLREIVSSSQRNRTDWESNNIHMILFDESNDSDYFPAGSGTVAITPVWFYSNGRIADADILFNGQGFQFTTSGQTGAFDVEDVGAHEIGHLLSQRFAVGSLR
jgi:hypothetical protein